MTIILGIDPGSLITGYGILHQKENKIIYLNSGYIRTNKIDNIYNRIKSIFITMNNIINKFKPDCLAIEQVFVSPININSALILGQASSAAIIAALNFNLLIYEYSNCKIKKIITGNGTANKNKVLSKVKKILNLSINLQIDASDALAVAITHCYINNKII